MSKRDDPIAVLLVQTAKHDAAAFRELYELTAPRQLAIAARLLGRRDLAEEAVQDAYVSIWDKAENFNPITGSAQGWITTITRRRAIDRLRASPWLKREIDIDWMDTIPASPDIHEDRLALQQCLDRLSNKVQSAIRLAYLYGLTHLELSKMLNLPLGTLKSQLRRGLAALKECLST
ncbi:MAG: sigma-70 family RNA polymerase sigma factor [Paracoccaceae bacterium]